MKTAIARSAYQQSEAQAQIHPVKLIHLLYERVLVHLDLAEQGLQQHDPKTRGENLSKAIAIVAELNASIKESDDSEAARFLRGLYTAILVELPKVGITGDGTIIRQAHRYLSRLRDIWEDTAMREAGLLVEADRQASQLGQSQSGPQTEEAPEVCVEYGIGGPKKLKTMDAAACHLRGVSVSI